MVLLDSDLQKFLISETDIQDNRGEYLTLIKNKRDGFFMLQYEDNKKYIVEAKDRHRESMQFLKSIENKEIDKIVNYLWKNNIGAKIPDKLSRTLVLLDATGSMCQTLESCKTAVEKMIFRTVEVLKEHAVNLTVEMQFTVYRNYNCKENTLFEFSPWEVKADNLKQFLKKATCEGGMGAEAIEIGLLHANTENAIKKISQIILIGDAGPNSTEETNYKRENNFGKSYWDTTKYKDPTYFQNELNKIITAKIPIHAFLVGDNTKAKEKFQEIASSTKGQFDHLKADT
jgi:hypothetical protein